MHDDLPMDRLTPTVSASPGNRHGWLRAHNLRTSDTDRSVTASSDRATCPRAPYAEPLAVNTIIATPSPLVCARVVERWIERRCHRGHVVVTYFSSSSWPLRPRPPIGGALPPDRIRHVMQVAAIGVHHEDICVTRRTHAGSHSGRDHGSVRRESCAKE